MIPFLYTHIENY